jgi:type I restriction enzyme S subunit
VMLARSGSPLPRDWSRLRFGDCAEFINGRAYAQDELLETGTPVLRIQNLSVRPKTF